MLLVSSLVFKCGQWRAANLFYEGTLPVLVKPEASTFSLRTVGKHACIELSLFSCEPFDALQWCYPSTYDGLSIVGAAL